MGLGAGSLGIRRVAPLLVGLERERVCGAGLQCCISLVSFLLVMVKAQGLLGRREGSSARVPMQ